MAQPMWKAFVLNDERIKYFTSSKGHIAATNNLGKIKRNLIDKKARWVLKQLIWLRTVLVWGGFFKCYEGLGNIKNLIRWIEGRHDCKMSRAWEGKFGIRIENLVYVKKEKNKLKFQNLTMAQLIKIW